MKTFLKAIADSFYLNYGDKMATNRKVNLNFHQTFPPDAAHISALLSLAESESAYTKEEIFELYANLTPYGDGIIGVANASNAYFKVRPNKLTYPQASLLAGLPQAPSAYAPRHHFDRAKLRQKKVLQNCVDVEYITQKEADEYYKTRLKIF